MDIFKVIYIGWFLDKKFKKEMIYGYFTTDREAFNWCNKDLMNRTYSYVYFKGEAR